MEVDTREPQTVTAIIKDFPANVHFKIDIVAYLTSQVLFEPVFF